jgi:hypothetical protein
VAQINSTYKLKLKTLVSSNSTDSSNAAGKASKYKGKAVPARFKQYLSWSIWSIITALQTSQQHKSNKL